MPLYRRLKLFEGGGSTWPIYKEQVHMFFCANDMPEEKQQRDIFLASCGTQVFSLLLNLLKPATRHTKMLKPAELLMLEHASREVISRSAVSQMTSQYPVLSQIAPVAASETTVSQGTGTSSRVPLGPPASSVPSLPTMAESQEEPRAAQAAPSATAPSPSTPLPRRSKRRRRAADRFSPT
ncbi:hypothetical protein MRX96_010477 [Rhipicephalus microplus]